MAQRKCRISAAEGYDRTFAGIDPADTAAAAMGEWEREADGRSFEVVEADANQPVYEVHFSGEAGEELDALAESLHRRLLQAEFPEQA